MAIVLYFLLLSIISNTSIVLFVIHLYYLGFFLKNDIYTIWLIYGWLILFINSSSCLIIKNKVRIQSGNCYDITIFKHLEIRVDTIIRHINGYLDCSDQLIFIVPWDGTQGCSVHNNSNFSFFLDDHFRADVVVPEFYTSESFEPIAYYFMVLGPRELVVLATLATDANAYFHILGTNNFNNIGIGSMFWDLIFP